MKSFGLLRTNVALTTNIRVVVDSDYNLSLDSIESNSDLSVDKYKKVKFNKKNYYDELIPYFYKNLPSSSAFQIKYDDDVDKMSSDFSKQYDEIYQYGARNILNNKNYKEEFEYFAPLYIDKNNLPSNFIIFRVDGPGIDLMTKENFVEDIVKKFKTVKIFDFSLKTALGEWLYNNYKNNPYFPISPLEIDFRELEFCKWNGIDYKSGGYTSKSFFIDDFLEEEKEIFEFEKFITDSYEKNSIVFPNILNFSFLFNDEPSTPEIKRKWSLNRYFGFYIDKIDKFKSLSPYITPFLKDDVVISSGNYIYSVSSQDPFLLGFSEERPFYVEYSGEYYKVERLTEFINNQLQNVTTSSSDPFAPKKVVEQYVNQGVYKYKIISDIDLSGKQNSLNQNYVRIDDQNSLIGYNNTYLEVFEEFDKYSVWLIEIDGIYHNLINDDGVLRIVTDYSFTFNENDYTYKVAGKETKVSFKVDENSSPKKFSIYRLSFSDIKDFDTRIVDTESSKFEYIKDNELTITDETKMYVENLLTITNPKDYDDYIYEGEVVNIPTTSEYTANYETFKINKGELSSIWRKNSVYCRWGFMSSISSNDYPYLLNNSSIFEDFNRTVNPFDPDPKRIERNLDYFYSINSSTSSYSHHSLHVEGYDENGDMDLNFNFDISKYLNVYTYSVGDSFATYSSDYFTDFFYRKQQFSNGDIIKNVKKYSEFTPGDNSLPNVTLFRGLKFYVYDVDSIEITKENEIGNINLLTNNKYEGYKFSILLTDHSYQVGIDGVVNNIPNSLVWQNIEEWCMDKVYATNSIVIFDDILYKANETNETNLPEKLTTLGKVRTAPYNLDSWDYFSLTQSIYWNPMKNYQIGDFVLNNDDFYECVSLDPNSEDFWNPESAKNGLYNAPNLGTYSTVLYKGNYYVSLLDGNTFLPNKSLFTKSQNAFVKPWDVVNNESFDYMVKSPKWKSIEIWNPINNYTSNKLIVHNQIIWKSDNIVNPGSEPGVSTLWVKMYSLEPDTTTIYTESNNPIIEINGNLMVCSSNQNSYTLQNGIVVYVNKKWKNILIDINISDNTLDNIKNCDRDELYNQFYKRLTAQNIKQIINDIDKKYGFIDYLTYVIIDESGKITKHNFSENLSKLNCLIRVEDPDELLVRDNSLIWKVSPNPEKLKPYRKLSNGEVKNLTQLNWYNDLPYAVDIESNKVLPKILVNKHGSKNIVNNSIWRYSGYYSPIFYDIELFDKTMDGISDNTKFDTDLTYFGMMRERKIQKVNRNGSILKLKNEGDYKSIYPMLDEFGYTIRDFFIFSSTWDIRYHYESYILTFKPKFDIQIPSIKSDIIKDFGQPKTIESLNKKRTNL